MFGQEQIDKSKQAWLLGKIRDRREDDDEDDDGLFAWPRPEDKR